MEIPEFTLGPELTEEQETFFAEHGFIRFRSVASAEEIQSILSAMDRMQSQFIEEERELLMGVPIQWGVDEQGERFVNRFAYSSCYSEAIRAFVKDPRFDPVRRMAGEEARLAEDEKDGVVINHFVNHEGSNYKRLGWHTDSPRDIFYNLRLPGLMLNVGLYLDDCPLEKGGVRLIPGTQNQGLWMTLFRKFPMFFNHSPDQREVALTTRAGDLTVHDGRVWHRTAQATVTGDASRRRTMYLAYIDEPYDPRTEESAIPLFKRLQRYVG